MLFYISITYGEQADSLPCLMGSSSEFLLQQQAYPLSINHHITVHNLSARASCFDGRFRYLSCAVATTFFYDGAINGGFLSISISVIESIKR